VPVLAHNTLETFCAEVLAAASMRADEARQVAHHLVEAEMKNVVSHGVNRVAYYLDCFANGLARPAGDILLAHNGATVLTVDGGEGLGIPAMERAVDQLLAMGRDQPIVCAGIHNVGHTGRMGAYVERLAANGRFALSMGGGGCDRFPLVAAHGGRGGVLSTNPWAMAMPGGGAGDVSVDFATCVVANGKVSVRRRTGESVPEGWLADKHGNPTTSIEAYDDGGALLPAGGYKGYGLSVLAEMMGGAMLGQPYEFNWMIVALDTNAFGAAAFDKDAAHVIEKLRATPPAPGFDKVRVPGDPERETEERCRRDGINLHDGVWDGLVAAAQSQGVAIPAIG
tara:strand:- start:340 stop:1356 length:1017 start_codon:yes stop_codon:yes gene_type:complete